jgi:hypothetical protein
MREFMGLGAGKGYSTAKIGLIDPGFTFKGMPASKADCTAKVAKPCHVVSPLGTAW